MNVNNLRLIRDHMKTVHRDNLEMEHYSARAQTAYNSLEAANEDNLCNTSACVVGHATSVIPFVRSDLDVHGDISVRFMINWVRYSVRISGIKLGKQWDFLFGSEWPNDPVQVIRRINFALQNKHNFVDWAYAREDYKLELGEEYDIE